MLYQLSYAPTGVTGFNLRGEFGVPCRLNGSKIFEENFGDDRIRTCDILLAKQALYQLSYIPKCKAPKNRGP